MGRRRYATDCPRHAVHKTCSRHGLDASPSPSEVIMNRLFACFFIAGRLPVGLSGTLGASLPYADVDVGTDGTAHFSADRNNAIYRVGPI